MTIRDPKYGVPLNSEDLTTSDPCAVLYGVTPTNKFIPIQIDDEGRLRLGSGVTLDVDSLELGDVGIVGKDPVTNIDHQLSITNLGVNGWGLRSTLYDIVGNGITSTLSGGKQALDVNLAGTPSLTITLSHTTSNILVYGNDGVNDQKIKTDGSGQLQVGVVSSVLPSGAATEITLGNIKTQTDKLTFSGTRLLTDVSGSVSVSNSSLAVTQSTSPWVVSGSMGRSWTLSSGTDTVSAVQSGLWSVRLQDGSGNTISSTSNALDVNIKSSSSPSTPASIGNISRSNASQTFLAVNTNRKGATIYNDASANLYVKFGTTATSADFTVRLQSQDYYEVPFNYVGRIDGVWASNGTGNALVTELT